MNKRASLAAFVPQPVLASADGAKIVEATAAAPTTRKEYPKITVYLTAEEVRTLKLIALDTKGVNVSDIAAQAIRDYLERNGHARGKAFSA